MNRYFLWILASIGIGISAGPGTSADVAVSPKPIVGPKISFAAMSLPASDVIAQIRKDANVIVELPAEVLNSPVKVDKTMPFWASVETLADATQCRVSVRGDKIVLTKVASGSPKPITSADSAFRVVAKQVITKRDLESGYAICEIAYEIQWLPTIPVYLIDAEPLITAAKFGDKSATQGKPASRVAPNGSAYSGTIRLAGVPRSATQLDVVTGEFKVIGAARMMTVEFKDLTIIKNATQISEGVSVTMRPLKKVGDRVEMTFDMEYPTSHPLFESFQLWAASNKLRLIGPDERNAFTPADYNTEENGRNVSATYLFSAGKGQAMPNLKGWKAQYETPVPMVEQTVKFEWKNIPLP